jgi:hypothetical protein
MEILRAVSPKAWLESHSGNTPPDIAETDGIGEELLRSKSYDWILTTRCKYVVQHSCFGWESINVRSLFYPNLLLRAILRTRKLYRNNKFKEIYVYSGARLKTLRHSVNPWRKICIIDKKSFEEICRQASTIEKLQSEVDLNGSDNKTIIIVASGDFTDLYHQITQTSDSSEYQILIKQHPQQESRLPDFLNSKTYLVPNKSVPAELVIEKYNPHIIYGVKSTVQYYSYENYRIYNPSNWRYSQESDFLARYRMALEQPLFKVFYKFMNSFLFSKYGSQ